MTDLYGLCTDSLIRQEFCRLSIAFFVFFLLACSPVTRMVGEQAGQVMYVTAVVENSRMVLTDSSDNVTAVLRFFVQATVNNLSPQSSPQLS